MSSYWGPVKDARNVSMPLPYSRRRLPLPLLRPVPSSFGCPPCHAPCPSDWFLHESPPTTLVSLMAEK
eukprot:9200745-Pyramimonas_sp.AAC.1